MFCAIFNFQTRSKAKEITLKVDSLLNAMRADLGNEAYIRNEKAKG